jgi:hypothetical protein
MTYQNHAQYQANLAKLQNLEEQLRKMEAKQARTDSVPQKVGSVYDELQDLKKERANLEARERKLQRRMEEMRPMQPDERRAVADAQARADAVYRNLNRQAPVPKPFEREMEYRQRVLNELRRYSAKNANTDFSLMDSKGVLKHFEGEVYADASHPNAILIDADDDELIPTVEIDQYTGQRKIHYRGRNTFIKHMKPKPFYAGIIDPLKRPPFYPPRRGR